MMLPARRNSDEKPDESAEKATKAKAESGASRE